MQPMLTSSYYVSKMCKSNDAFELADAANAFVEFKRTRYEYSVKKYCDSLRKLDFDGMAEAVTIQLM